MTNVNLKNLKKSELLEIISNLTKKDLINIINNNSISNPKIGGFTSGAKKIKINSTSNQKNIPLALSNNNEYLQV